MSIFRYFRAFFFLVLVFCVSNVFSMNLLTKPELENLERIAKTDKYLLKEASNKDVTNILDSIHAQRIVENINSLFPVLFEIAENTLSHKKKSHLFKIDSKVKNGQLDLTKKNKKELGGILKDIETPENKDDFIFLYESIQEALLNKIHTKKKKEKPCTLPTLPHFELEQVKESEHSICITTNGFKIDKKRLEKLQDIILNDPKNIIKENAHSLCHWNKIKETFETIKKSTYPEVCLLSECNCSEQMNRLASNTRTEFENKFAEKVKFMDSNYNIRYLGFGSGDLFADFRILVLLILKNKGTINTVHLVDNSYSKVIETLKKISKEKKAYSYSIEDIQLYLQSNKTQMTSDQEYNSILVKIIRFIQFVSFLRSTNNFHIDLYLHKTASDYLNFVKEDISDDYNSKKANLLTLIDPNISCFDDWFLIKKDSSKVIKINHASLRQEGETYFNTVQPH